VGPKLKEKIAFIQVFLENLGK